MPQYTDSPLGSFLMMLGQGLPALAQNHRARNIQDQQLAQKKLFDQSALKTQGLQQQDMQDRLDLAPIEKQKAEMELTTLKGRDAMFQQMLGPGGQQGGPFSSDQTRRIIAKQMFPNVPITDIFPPVSEPTVTITSPNKDGQIVQQVIPRSQAVGREFPVAPTGAQRTQLANTEANVGIMDRLDKMIGENPTWQDWVGPAAGRVGVMKQVIPGFSVDPKQSEFYANSDMLLNHILNQLSGAAVSPHEDARIRGEVPNKNDKPEVFLPKMKAARENAEYLRDVITARQSGGPVPASQEEWRMHKGGGMQPQGVPQMQGAPQMQASPQASGKVVPMTKVAQIAQKNGWSIQQAVQMAQSEGWTVQ